jgi:hypothetical protein
MLRPLVPLLGLNSDASSRLHANCTTAPITPTNCTSQSSPPGSPRPKRKHGLHCPSTCSPHHVGHGGRPGNQAQPYISTLFARLPPLPSSLTTPLGSQIHHKNLKTFFESLEISSRTLSIICASIFLPRHSFRHSFNNCFPSIPIRPTQRQEKPPTAAMFKRSIRSTDRVDKVVKLKKSYRDPAKLSKLQKSFDQSPPVGRYVAGACLPSQTRLMAADEIVRSTLTSPIMTFTVGKEGRLFAAHEDVLSLSPFFAAACRGQFLEAESKRIDLPDEEPEIFSCVLEYLYVCLPVP